MTPQEQQMLQDLTDRINQTQLSEKDPDAEKFIFQALGRNTNSLYIMAQTILVQQYALDNAKKQLDDAKGQVDDLSQQLNQARQQASQPQKHTSFLGSLLGTDEPRNPPPPPQQQYGQPQYAPVANYGPPPPPYVQPPYAQPAYQQGYGAPPSQGGGFLRSAMTTATGVAAGALAFEGIESLMHGFGHSGGGYGGDRGFEGQPREEIVNNYYGDSDSIGNRAEHAGGLSPDIEDRRNDNQSNFSASDSSDDMSGGGDDYGTDDSGGDDNSSGGDDYGTDDSN